jgi:hypothetical protein
MRSSAFTVAGVALVLVVACGEEGVQENTSSTRAPLEGQVAEDETLLSGEALTAPPPRRTVDGSAADWSTRVPPFDDMGIIVRNAAQDGEYVFLDAMGDHREDLGATQPVDLRRVAFTADDENLYALILFGGTTTVSQIPQVQITVDLDRVASSGQQFLAGFADTAVTGAAEWERLIQTRFAQTPAGSGARVLDGTFSPVGSATGVHNTPGTIEIGVPWSALGLSGPPQAPLRFTVSSYVSSNSNDDTTDVGGPAISNALDAIGDCGDPRQLFPDAFVCDLSDADIDFFADVYFARNGVVYSPLLISRFVANSSDPEPAREWVEFRNVSPVPISLDNVKVGDEEEPDASTGVERMVVLPPGTILAPGAVYTLGASGAAYQALYGVPPQAEISDTSAVPNATAFAAWFAGAPGSFGLANNGDQILLLDPSNTILDVANWGAIAAGAFPGVTPTLEVLVDDEILVRAPTTQDTDDNAVDLETAQCTVDLNCNDNNPCTDDTCVQSLCVHANNTVTCDDGNYCNGTATCAGGSCVPGTPPVCPDDGNYCNGVAMCDEATDSCVPGPPPVCPDDGIYCNGAEACDEATDSCGHVNPPSCPSDNLYCNGTEACDEATDSCGRVNPPSCPSDNLYCNGTEACDEATDSCGRVNPPSCPSDNLYCNGTEACDEATDSCGHVNPPSCPSDNLYCNGTEACDEATDSCGHVSPPSCPDDGLYCNGAEACIEATDTCGHVTAPVCPDADLCNGVETCDETSNSCASGTPVTCAPLDQCHVAGTCNPTSGVCSNPSANDGTLCTGGSCIGGICVPSGGGGSGGGGAGGGSGVGGAGAGGAAAGAGGAAAGGGGAAAGAGGAAAGAGGAAAGAGGAAAGAGGAAAGAGGAAAGAGGAAAGAGGAAAGAGGAAAGAGGAAAGTGGMAAGASGASGVGGGAGVGGAAGAGGGAAGGVNGGSAGTGAGRGGEAGQSGGEAGAGAGGDAGSAGEGVGGDGVGGSSSGRGGSSGSATGGTAGDLAGAGGEGDGEGGSGGGGADEDSGCGCAVPGSSGRPLFPGIAFALFAFACSLRRARRSAHTG